MSNETTVQELLRWRQTLAAAAAPPSPRASRLLSLTRPWWETAPEQFRALAKQLGQMRLAYGHAMEEHPGHRGHHVPAVIVGTEQEQELFAQLLYFSVRDNQLRLRFRFEAKPGPDNIDYEVTFVSTADQSPLFTGQAIRSVEQEFRLEVDLTEALAADWARLKVTDDMPYRFLLRPLPVGGFNA
jgi:hypothetical protein